MLLIINKLKVIDYIIRKTIIISFAFSAAFTILLWIYPDGLLMFFNLHQIHNDESIETAIRLFSLSFIPYAFTSILIFYYEAIERITPAAIVSFISALGCPLLFSFLLLYPIIGVNGIWLSFLCGMILTILAALLCSKITERKGKEYYGLFYIKKDLIPKTRNYEFENIEDRLMDEMHAYLKSLNIDERYCRKVDKIVKLIFEGNEDNVLVDVLIINYGDTITVNIKDDGKRNIIKDNAELSSDKEIFCSEVLGLNNVKLDIDHD